MKKIILTAITVFSAMFIGCSDAGNFMSASSDNETVSEQSASNDDSLEKASTVHKSSERHYGNLCVAAADTNSTIFITYDITDSSKTITRVFIPDVVDNFDVTCEIALMNAKPNETVECSDVSVGVISKYENQTESDYQAMLARDCRQE